jgi:hypothetical protein
VSSLGFEWFPDSAGRENLRRFFSTTEQVTARYPTDPEAWFALGEARFHLGHGLGLSDEMMFEPFHRAVTLDSSYAPAYIHLVELALRLGSQSTAQRHAARYLTLRPGGDHALAMRAASWLLDTAIPGMGEVTALGYEDPAFFRQLFRRHTGLSPTEYRSRFSGMSFERHDREPS